MQLLLSCPLVSRTITSYAVHFPIPVLLVFDKLDFHDWNNLNVRNHLLGVQDRRNISLYRVHGHIFLRNLRHIKDSSHKMASTTWIYALCITLPAKVLPWFTVFSSIGFNLISFKCSKITHVLATPVSDPHPSYTYPQFTFPTTHF